MWEMFFFCMVVIQLMFVEKKIIIKLNIVYYSNEILYLVFIKYWVYFYLMFI